jgi:hypothetical protein
MAPRIRTSWFLPLACLLLVAGCERKSKIMSPASSNHPTISLFGFEESQLHHIHNTVELHRNLFLVRYDPDQPDNLEWVNCPVPAEYVYRKANGRRVESTYVKNYAELKAKVPVNAARFEGFVRGGTGLQFDYVTIGSYELVGGFKIPADDPDCKRATHYVVTLSVGAFAYGESKGIEGGLAAEVAGTGAGGGITGGRESGKVTSVGDIEACMDDGTAFTDCFTPLQVMMVPLAQRDWDGQEVVVAEVMPDRPEPTPQEQEQAPMTSLALAVDPEQWGPGYYMAMALQQVLVVASRINDTTNFGYDDKAGTVVAGYLKPERPQALRRVFEAGQSYVVFATGATDQADLDIIVMSPSGELLAADVENDENPIVTFVAPETGQYEINLQMAAGEEEFGAMVVMRDGGIKIRPDILQPAFQTMLDNTKNANLKVIEAGWGNGLIFYENDWSLTSTILYPGESIRQNNLVLDQITVFSAVAHDPNMNIDLIVSNTNGFQVSDFEPDANPLLLVDTPDPSARYDAAISYGTGTDPVLATGMITTLSQ